MVTVIEEPRDPLLLRLLVEAARAYENAVIDLMAERGEVRPAHFAVFRHLDPAGSRIGDLARDAGMTGQSMGELVAKMRDLGYVEVVPDPGDGRARLVVPTEAGAAAVARFAGHVRDVEDRIAATIGVDGLFALRNLLDELPTAIGQ